MTEINVGDVVQSTAGRDKDRVFLVTAISDGRAYLVDGRKRRPDRPKKKNVKHIIKVGEALLKDEALKIKRGEPISGDRLYKAVQSAVHKK